MLRLARAWDPAGGGNWVGRFALFFEEVLRIHRAHQSVITAIREAAAYDSTVGYFYTENPDGFEETALRTLLSEQAAGTTAADIDAVSASRIIAWGGAQAIAHHIQVDDGQRDAVFARESARIRWHGAYRRVAEPDHPQPPEEPPHGWSRNGGAQGGAVLHAGLLGATYRPRVGSRMIRSVT
ncbi:hypothetical protein ACIQAC_34870 [Streptomyces sp. NPDC088387]|uniref:hypothetical protein n=1 Tax=Streptomyces sp. NPDC088387 TaxID=3365859 RepID=UPI0038244CC6